MRKILVVESDARDAESFQSLLANEEIEIAHCDSGAAAERVITPERKAEFVAAVILWEIPGPPFGFSLLARCRQMWPEAPVVIVSGMLDATLAARAQQGLICDFVGQRMFERVFKIGKQARFVEKLSRL